MHVQEIPSVIIALFLVISSCAIGIIHLRKDDEKTKNYLRLLWYFSLILCVFLSAILYLRLRYESQPNDPPTVPKELTLKLEVRSLKSTPIVTKENYGFVATVQDPPKTFPYDARIPIHCFLESSETFPLLTEGSFISAKGVLTAKPEPWGLELQYSRGVIKTIDHLENGAESHQQVIKRHLVACLDEGWFGSLGFSTYTKSMITGDKSFLTEEQRSAFQRAGIIHYLAISGFHLSVVAAFTYWIFRTVRLSQIASQSITLVMCLIYIWVTGFPVSAQRALLLISLFFVAQIACRKPSLLSATIAGAWIIILIEPRQLSSPGYQLSFVVVISIICYALPLYRRLSKLPKRVSSDTLAHRTWYHGLLRNSRNYFLGSVCVCWAAFWISLPVVSAYFSWIPWCALLVNPIVAPLFAVGLVVGWMSILCHSIRIVTFSTLLNQFNNLLFGWIDQFVLFVSNTPLSGQRFEFSPFFLAITMLINISHLLILDLNKSKHFSSFAILPGTVLLMIGAQTLQA